MTAREIGDHRSAHIHALRAITRDHRREHVRGTHRPRPTAEDLMNHTPHFLRTAWCNVAMRWPAAGAVAGAGSLVERETGARDGDANAVTRIENLRPPTTVAGSKQTMP